MTARTNMVKQAAVASLLATALACGGSNGGGSNNPNTPGSGGGTPGPVGATITIGANDTVSPSTVTINPGESVTFVNNGTRSHQMASDPHPAHTDCPGINAVGVVDRGQSRTSNALTASRTCGFHDHNEETNAGLRGSIVIR